MTDGLGDVDWASLTHAYGPADDVPELIRGLRSADAEECLDALHSRIVHQGTRYPASAAAVPFLLALAEDPATPGRGALIELLTSLAIGPAEAEWRRYPVGELRAAGPSAALAAYDAVARGVPMLVDLLGDTDLEIAVPVTRALACFPEHAEVSAPALAGAAADGDAPVVLTTTALLALGAVAPVGSSAYEDLLRARMRDDDRSVRWAAALTAARLRTAAVLPGAVAELTRWAAATDDESSRYGRRPDLALAELDEIDPDGHDDRIRPIILRLLGEEPSSGWHHHMSVILARAGLPAGREPVPWDYLRPAQQELLARLCRRPDVFAAEPVLRPLVRAGLPGTLDELRAYVPGRR